MSLFGSSSKTYYTSTSVPLFEKMPSLLSQTVKGSIAMNRNISDDLITNLVNGIGFKANQLYNYGKSGQYPWGLPDGSATHFGTEVPNKLKLIIQKEIGKIILLISNSIKVDPVNNHMIYYADYYLLDDRGNSTEETGSWSYDESLGTHPTLDLNEYDIQNVSPYFPVIPIRSNNVSERDKSNKLAVSRACKYLGIDLDDLTDSIEKQSESGDNPTEDAYVILGVEITDQTQEGLQYLHTYFSHMQGVSQVTKEDYLYWFTNSKDKEGEYYDSPPPVNTVQVKDANYQMELGWLYIAENIITGSVGDGRIGTYSSEYNPQPNFNFTGDTYYSPSDYVVRKQVTATQYSELVVKGLTHSNWAVGKELNTTLNAAYGDAGDDLNHSFTIPLRKDLLKVLGPLKIHDLMYSSIRLVVNDKLTVKLKWYQTGIFKFAMVVIAIAVSLWNPVAGAFIFSATAVVNTIITLIITQMVLPIAMAKLKDLVGEELALIVAVVATFATAKYMGSSTFTSSVQAGMKGVSGGMHLYFADAMADINKEMELLGDDINELEDELLTQEQNTLFASTIADADTFALTNPSKYVDITKRINKLPTLITKTTESYTDIMRYLDQPYSPIQLGNRLI